MWALDFKGSYDDHDHDDHDDHDDHEGHVDHNDSDKDNNNNNNNNNNTHLIPSGVGSSIVLLIPEGEGQDLFFLFHPYPASQPRNIWNIHTGEKGGWPTPSSLLLYTARSAQQWQWLLVASSRTVATWNPKVVRS